MTNTPTRRARLGLAAYVVAMLIYAATRLIGLADFPIYFFSDEAIQATSAADLIANDFRGEDGLLLPPYFKNFAVWNLGLSVYLQLLPVRLFGMSVFITRLVSVLVGMMGVAAVAGALRVVFRARGWYLSVLVLATTPAWFLHSRTAFETVEMVAFYALFLFCYLLYRTRHPRWIFPALLFAAAAFYSYSNGQVIIGLLALLLAVVDAPYHWEQMRNTRYEIRDTSGEQSRISHLLSRISPVVLFVILAALLAAPYIRFRLSQPTDLAYHLRSLDSYWFNDTSTADKLGQFAGRYSYGLSPGYWFRPNDHDLARHRMVGYYGHMRPEFLPLLLLGVVVAVGGALRRERGEESGEWRSHVAPPSPLVTRHSTLVTPSAYRAVLLALLVAPVGAALVDIAITRVLSAVVPATLLVGIGVDWIWRKLEAWKGRKGAGEKGSGGERDRPFSLSPLLPFALLALMSLGMLRLALSEGPLWHTDYGMSGMQYGAPQLFEVIEQRLAADPDAQVILTPDWANGTNLFPRFFLPPEQQARVSTFNVDAFIGEKRPLNDDMLFIMLPGEVDRAMASGKFAAVTVEESIPYPDGRPGFLLGRLAYQPDIDAVFAAELEALRQPVTEQGLFAGAPATITHTRFEAGQWSDLVDGDPFTLVRHIPGNPARYDIAFDTPRPVGGLSADFGTMDFVLTVTLLAPDGETAVYEQTFAGLGPDPHIEMVFPDAPPEVGAIGLEIFDVNRGDGVRIHVRELGIED